MSADDMTTECGHDGRHGSVARTQSVDATSHAVTVECAVETGVDDSHCETQQRQHTISSCDGTFDDVQRPTPPTAAAAGPRHRKLANKLRGKLTSLKLSGGKRRRASAVSQRRHAVKSASSSWLPSKKLILEPCQQPTCGRLEKAADEVTDGVTKPCQRLSNKSLSLKSRRKQRSVTADRAVEVTDVTVDNASEMSEVAASQLAAEPRVIIVDIKREHGGGGGGTESQLTMETDDEETVVRETIILAADVAAGQRASSRQWSDYEADAHRLLRQYDGTQSVDIDELFDARNQSELIEHQVIEIEDDDNEWSQMPHELASVRFTLHCSVFCCLSVCLSVCV